MQVLPSKCKVRGHLAPSTCQVERRVVLAEQQAGQGPGPRIWGGTSAGGLPLTSVPRL